eukprot:Sdes_comp21479_c0_seq1m20105
MPALFQDIVDVFGSKFAARLVEIPAVSSASAKVLDFYCRAKNYAPIIKNTLDIVEFSASSTLSVSKPFLATMDSQLFISEKLRRLDDSACVHLSKIESLCASFDRDVLLESGKSRISNLKSQLTKKTTETLQSSQDRFRTKYSNLSTYILHTLNDGYASWNGSTQDVVSFLLQVGKSVNLKFVQILNTDYFLIFSSTYNLVFLSSLNQLKEFVGRFFSFLRQETFKKYYHHSLNSFNQIGEKMANSRLQLEAFMAQLEKSFLVKWSEWQTEISPHLKHAEAYFRSAKSSMRKSAQEFSLWFHKIPSWNHLSATPSFSFLNHHTGEKAYLFWEQKRVVVVAFLHDAVQFSQTFWIPLQNWMNSEFTFLSVQFSPIVDSARASAEHYKVSAASRVETAKVVAGIYKSQAVARVIPFVENAKAAAEQYKEVAVATVETAKLNVASYAIHARHLANKAYFIVIPVAQEA